jgi:uncharacterized protein YbjT (DUF2867 family)
MKIVVIGGTGLIGSKLVTALTLRGHDTVAASPNTGVNTVTGEGLDDALAGAQVVVDVSNSPSFEDRAVLAFFTTSNLNILAAEQRAGVRHHVALSVVGTDRLQGSGYFRGKLAQERLIAEGKVPYTIVHSTQFFEFMGAIAHSGTESGSVRLPNALMQPISSDDVAAALTDVALSAPQNGIVEVAGPERVRMADGVKRYLAAIRDSRTVVPDEDAPYFGVKLDDASLMPAASARIGTIRFESWLGQQLGATDQAARRAAAK